MIFLLSREWSRLLPECRWCVNIFFRRPAPRAHSRIKLRGHPVYHTAGADEVTSGTLTAQAFFSRRGWHRASIYATLAHKLVNQPLLLSEMLLRSNTCGETAIATMPATTACTVRRLELANKITVGENPIRLRCEQAKALSGRNASE